MLSNLLLSAAVLLLAINVVGASGIIGVPRLRYEPWSLRAFAASLPDPKTCEPDLFCMLLSQALSERFRHGPARHTVWSNYLLCMLPRWAAKYATIELSADLFRHSDQAHCHQIAQAFVDVATRRGIEARMAGLDGHVVAEAFYYGGWHVFDPDYGVILHDQDRVVSLEELLEDPDLTRRLYRNHRLKNDVEALIAVFEKKIVVRAPSGGHLSPRTAAWQRGARIAKWLLPVGMIGLALLLKFGS